MHEGIDLMRGFRDAKLGIVIGILSVVCVALLVLSVYLFLTKDRTVVSNDSIREEILPVARLTTYEYNFTSVMFLSDAGNPINLHNPITTKRYVATIDGTVPVQLDAESITCEGAFSVDGSLNHVKVYLPHSYIGEVTLFHDSAKKYVEDNGFLNLNQVSTDDLNNLYIQVEDEQAEKLENSGVVQRADGRAQELIQNQIKSIHGDAVGVDFEYID